MYLSYELRVTSLLSYELYISYEKCKAKKKEKQPDKLMILLELNLYFSSMNFDRYPKENLATDFRECFEAFGVLLVTLPLRR